MKHNTLILHLVYSVTIIIIIVVGVLLFVTWCKDPDVDPGVVKPDSVYLQIGHSRLPVQLTGTTLVMKDVMFQVFNNEATETPFLALLREYDLYRPSDLALFEALEKLKCDHPVVERLRKLCESCTPKQAAVVLSAPAGNRICEGRAASCRSHPFFRRKMKIWNEHRDRSVTVYVGNSFDCPEKHKELVNLIQLSTEDMKRLIGPSPIARTEKGFAEELISAQ